MVQADIADQLRHEVRTEAEGILRWWQTHMVDAVDGGFWGEVGPDDKPVAKAPKAIVLYTRLLWFFSAAASHLESDGARSLADRAYAYIREHFLDRDRGGLYWLLDHQGHVIDDKKQTYAQAFGVYALAEYYDLTGDEDALVLARRLLTDMDQYLWDENAGGYIEALSVDWRVTDDQRLSDKDVDAPKTMNTHLHVIEACTRLYAVAPDTQSRMALTRIIDQFIDRFVDSHTHHLRLFFDMDWSDRTHAVSFGHDIEASWLLWEAAETLGDADRMARLRPLVIGMACVTLHQGFNGRGGIAYEQDFDGRRDNDGEWWGQAEGLVGFVNAWQLTGEVAFLEAADTVWHYVQEQYGAGKGDEWTWYGKDAQRPPREKAGKWKCPYHNGRAMFELDRRLRQ